MNYISPVINDENNAVKTMRFYTEIISIRSLNMLLKPDTLHREFLQGQFEYDMI